MRRKIERVAKLCGADIELGNFILGGSRVDETDTAAAGTLLREIEGVPNIRPFDGGTYNAGVSRSGGAAPFDPCDWGRKFLPTTGGCAYVDQWHAELCIPEVLSARDHVAAWHGALRVAQAALAAANLKQPAGQRLCVQVNNSDGRNSWGAHLNFLLTRRAWDNLINRRLHYQAFLAALQVSSICITGQGKVGADNDAPGVEFQLSQRADFFETLVAQQTTYNRPLLNSRDESLCGIHGELARYHCIFFDSNLCQVAHYLKVGIMQIGLAMLEAECVDTRLALEDPVETVVRWSHDPTLLSPARMVRGEMVTIVELQERFWQAARRFVDDGGCDGIVPEAGAILELWRDTLAKLRAGDLNALAARLDWALKLSLLTRALLRRPGLSWRSPEIRYLDQVYAALAPSEGLYWAYARGGQVEHVVSEGIVAHFAANPPEDTRAWTRAMLLRLAPRTAVHSIDWDSITFELPGRAQRYWRVDLGDPLAFTRARAEHLFQAGADLEGVLDGLGAAAVSLQTEGAQVGGSGWWPAAGAGGERAPSSSEPRVAAGPDVGNRSDRFN